MENNITPIFPAFFFPNIEYFANLQKHEKVIIEACENFPKQTFRNRTYILSANGVLSINVPIIKTSSTKQKISEVRISYKENWNIRAWRAITSAYGRSIYFEYFEDDIKKFFFDKYDKLFDINVDILKYFINKFDIKTNILFSQEYNVIDKEYDFRERFPVNDKKDNSNTSFKPYFQCFSEKFQFTENLSCLDLLMNTGKESSLYINF